MAKEESEAAGTEAKESKGVKARVMEESKGVEARVMEESKGVKEKVMEERKRAGDEECAEQVVHPDAVARVRAAMPDEDTLYDVAELFKVFGDSTRTRILSALFVSELCVCDISEILSMTKSAVSHQLRILRQTKVVKARRSGKEVFYSLDDEHIYKIYMMATEHLREGE